MRIITRLNIGGPSYQAIFLTQRLQDDEFQSTLLTGNVGPNEGSMESLADDRGVPFTRVKGLGREVSIKSDGLTVGRVYREIRRFSPHIVHTHLAKAGAVGRLAAKLARVPHIVHTYHGHVFRGYFSPRKTRLFLAIERRLARWSDRIIVLNEDQREEILGFGVGNPEQFACIPLGLELEPFLEADLLRGKLRAELGLSELDPTIGIVARLVPIKAHDLFLRAARLIAGKIANAQFVIVGDGETRESLRHQATELGFRTVHHDSGSIDRPPSNSSSDVDACVHFLGFRSDLAKIYADLDAVVVCSHNEGMPVAIIEALAAARPVVATDVGAIRSLVTHGETGLLVKPGDESGLAAAIQKQLDDREAATRMGRYGRCSVYPRLSIDRLEEDIRGLYLDLVRGASAEKERVLVGGGY